MFIGKYNKSLIITYIGVAFALVGMNFALTFENFKVAIICLLVAGVCDLFDGKVARMCKRTEEEKLYGIQIDSLADMVGFVVFPAVFGYAMGLTEWYHVLGYVLLVLGGITRLGYFNIMVCDNNRDKPIKYYSGLPVTSTSIILPFLYLVSHLMDTCSYHVLYTVCMYAIAFLFVANIKIPKFKGIAYPILAILAAITIVGVILL